MSDRITQDEGCWILSLQARATPFPLRFPSQVLPPRSSAQPANLPQARPLPTPFKAPKHRSPSHMPADERELTKSDFAELDVLEQRAVEVAIPPATGRTSSAKVGRNIEL